MLNHHDLAYVSSPMMVFPEWQSLSSRVKLRRVKHSLQKHNRWMGSFKKQNRVLVFKSSPLQLRCIGAIGQNIKGYGWRSVELLTYTFKPLIKAIDTASNVGKSSMCFIHLLPNNNQYQYSSHTRC